MKLVMFFIFLMLSNYCNAKQLITRSYSISEKESYKLENGTVHTNIKLVGLSTDNFGNYGKKKCFGVFTTHKNKNINLDMKCQVTDHKGNKSWSVIKRESNEFDAGVGINKLMELVRGSIL